MKFSLLCSVEVWLLVCVTVCGKVNADAVEDLALEGLATRAAYDATFMNSTSCPPSERYVRKEWSALSLPERKAYTDAVLCLQSKDPITPLSIVPGVRSRYDDFVATHINQTYTIHGTANFLGWHRYFVFTYEKALREECGYEGYQPWWNWGKYADDPQDSPIFDGSEYSMSGDGEYIPGHTGVNTTVLQLPPGTGGGCVYEGPFANMSVNLGPVAPVLQNLTANGDGFGYNPRCLRRDISTVAAAATTDNLTATLIADYDDILSFQNRMQGYPFDTGSIGVHTGGHYTIGGDPGGDFFASPGDPAFWLHHGQIDRVWWIWQNLDPETRLNAIAGSTYFFDQEPSPNGTLHDINDLGFNAPGVELGDLLDTTKGMFCYEYE